MKRDKGKIALPAARSAIAHISGKEPPNVTIKKARQLLGPELFNLIREGWLDEDIIAALSDDQNGEDLRRLLTEARSEERRKRRKREKAKAAKKAFHPTLGLQGSSGPVPPPSRVQGPGAAPMLAKPGPTLPSLPPPGAPRPITRNPGIRRPD